MKRQFLHFIFDVFQSQSIAETLPLPHLENKGTPYGNYTSGFDFVLFIVIFMHRRNKLYTSWTITDRVMTLCRFFEMAAIPSQIYFRFLVLWRLAFRKAENYLRIKFRPDISIHGQDITISGCWKQTSAIFKFDSGFRRTLYRHRYVILPRPANFVRNKRSAIELWRHIDLTKWRL